MLPLPETTQHYTAPVLNECVCGKLAERHWQGITYVVAGTHASMAFGLPQIPNRPARDRIRFAAVRGRRTTAWAMAWPCHRTFLDRHNNFRGNCFLRRTEIVLNSVILRAPDGTLSSLDPTKPACNNSWAVYRNYCAVANVSGQQTYLLIICSNCSCALRGLPQRV